jgi:hypothetical protein
MSWSADEQERALEAAREPSGTDTDEDNWPDSDRLDQAVSARVPAAMRAKRTALMAELSNASERSKTQDDSEDGGNGSSGLRVLVAAANVASNEKPDDAVDAAPPGPAGSSEAKRNACISLWSEDDDSDGNAAVESDEDTVSKMAATVRTGAERKAAEKMVAEAAAARERAREERRKTVDGELEARFAQASAKERAQVQPLYALLDDKAKKGKRKRKKISRSGRAAPGGLSVKSVHGDT